MMKLKILVGVSLSFSMLYPLFYFILMCSGAMKYYYIIFMERCKMV